LNVFHKLIDIQLGIGFVAGRLIMALVIRVPEFFKTLLQVE